MALYKCWYCGHEQEINMGWSYDRENATCIRCGDPDLRPCKERDVKTYDVYGYNYSKEDIRKKRNA